MTCVTPSMRLPVAARSPPERMSPAFAYRSSFTYHSVSSPLSLASNRATNGSAISMSSSPNRHQVKVSKAQKDVSAAIEIWLKDKDPAKDFYVSGEPPQSTKAANTK